MVADRRPAAVPWMARRTVSEPATSLVRPSTWTPHQRRLAWSFLTMLAWGALVFSWIWLNFNARDFMQDARAYWRYDYNHLYSLGTVGGRDAYLYSPAFAQLFFPAGALPWPVFKGLWCALNIGVLAWLAGPRWAALLLLFPGSPVSDEISTGNIQLLIAAAAVIAFSYPAAWAFTLLTKVTPGIGVLWFVGRRAWRKVGIALGATAAVSLASFVIGPHLWFEWADSLRHNTGVNIPAYAVALSWPLGVRIALAAVVALAGGVMGWRWTVLVACTLALPVLWWSGLSVLVGILYLVRSRPSSWRWTARRTTRAEFAT
jgi:hypothetical protein